MGCAPLVDGGLRLVLSELGLAELRERAGRGEGLVRFAMFDNPGEVHRAAPPVDRLLVLVEQATPELVGAPLGLDECPLDELGPAGIE